MSARRHEAVMPDSLPTAGVAASNYAYGVRAGDTLHIAGMVAFAPDESIVGEGDVEAQIEQALTNMKAVVEAAGGTMDDIVQTTTYLLDTTNAPLVAKARHRWFTGPVPPTHTIVGVTALGRPSLLVEIEATALLG